MCRTLPILLLSLAVACSSTAPDVRASLTDYLPERLVDGDESHATIVLGLDDVGYIDELHAAMVALGFPASTVYTIFVGSGRGTIDGKGVVASWSVDSLGVRVDIERG